MKKRFSTHGFEMTPNNLRQVRVPNGAQALPNAAGIAPGFVVRLGGAEAFFLPGVPREMEKIFTDEVVPRLKRQLAEAGRAGAGRAHLAPLRDGRVAHRSPPGRDPDRRRRRHAALPDLDARQPRQAGGARRRCRRGRARRSRRSTPRSASGSAPASTASTARRSWRAVSKALRAQEATLAFAESCTGGLAGELVTSESGATTLLPWQRRRLRGRGQDRRPRASSPRRSPTSARSASRRAREMAEGAKRVCGSTVAVAITGVAGPEGGRARQAGRHGLLRRLRPGDDAHVDQAVLGRPRAGADGGRLLRAGSGAALLRHAQTMTTDAPPRPSPADIRSFVAVPLPETRAGERVRGGRRAGARAASKDVKWSRKIENLHVTIKFLGPVEETKLAAFGAALAASLAGAAARSGSRCAGWAPSRRRARRTSSGPASPRTAAAWAGGRGGRRGDGGAAGDRRAREPAVPRARHRRAQQAGRRRARGAGAVRRRARSGRRPVDEALVFESRLGRPTGGSTYVLRHTRRARLSTLPTDQERTHGDQLGEDLGDDLGEDLGEDATSKRDQGRRPRRPAAPRRRATAIRRATRPSSWPSRRSRSSSARARSCASATRMAPPEVQVVPTGSLALDIALGIGGLPRGRIIEIYGPESSRQDDADAARRSPRRRSAAASARSSTPSTRSTSATPASSACKTDELLVSQPDYGEQALEIADMLVRSGAVDVIVIDSVAALVPKAEIEGEMGDTHVGLQARLMSQALRKLTGTISKSNTLVIFINQIRMKIGVMFGNPETTTGGNALKFYAIVRLDIRRIGAIKDGEKVDRQPHAGEGGEEQDGAAVPRGRVRHPLRPGHHPRGRPPRPRRRVRHRSRRAAPGSPSRASASARGARTPRSTCATTPTWPTRSRRRSSPTTASSATSAAPRWRRRHRRRGATVHTLTPQPKPVSDKKQPHSREGKSGLVTDRPPRPGDAGPPGGRPPAGWLGHPRKFAPPLDWRKRRAAYTIESWPPRSRCPKGRSRSPTSSRFSRCGTPCCSRGRSSPSTSAARSR